MGKNLWLWGLQCQSGRPLRSRVHSLVRARQVENSPSSKAYRRAQTVRPDFPELLLAHKRTRSLRSRPDRREEVPWDCPGDLHSTPCRHAGRTLLQAGASSIFVYTLARSVPN